MKPCDVVRATRRNSAVFGAIIAAAGAVALGGCASKPPAAHRAHVGHADEPLASGAPRIAVVNAYCPVAGTHVVGENKRTSEDLTRVWRGQRIGFCCDECPQWWDDMDDAERAESLAAAVELERTNPPGASPR